MYNQLGNGFVKIDIFRMVATQLINEFNITKEDIEEYIRLDVKDGNGVINYDDFIKCMIFNN